MDGKYTVDGIRYRSLSRANAARLATGMKRCSKCGMTYPVDQFTVDRNRSDGLTCTANIALLHTANPPDQHGANMHGVATVN